MILKLTRPLVFLDFETTGLDTENDRIVELAFVRLLPDGTRETLVQRVNPGVEISKGATKVTGIHTTDATGLFWGPPLRKVAAGGWDRFPRSARRPRWTGSSR